MALQRIETDVIEDDAVTTAKIAPNAVAAADIAAGAITNSKVAANAAIATSKVSGLGSAATLTAGTAANNVVQLDGSGNLPAVNGSALTNLDAADLVGALPAIDGSNLTGVSTDTTILENNIAILAFKTQAANNLAKFNLIDQVVDEYEDATGIDASASTNENFAGGAGAKYYSGGTAGSPASTVKSYTGANQTFTVPSGVSTITFKAWGAGGGSGGAGTAIGGGGGFVQENISVNAGETLNVKVGGGGQRIVNGASRKGGGGGWTSIDRSGTFLAGAGGGGGASDSPPGGVGGGTTGGDGGSAETGGEGHGGTQSAGGAGGTTRTGGTAGSAGQGGRAGVGSAVDATGGYNGGGLGDGDNATWTAGGGGGGYYGGGGGSNGGGGGGSSYAPTGTNTQASGGNVANSGDSDYQSSTGNGGSPNNNGQHGAAVLKYTPSTVQDLTLQSIANTALAAPTTGDIVMLIENASGTATLNTDIKAWISRNGGSGWDQATLVDKGTWGTNKKIITANNVAFSNSASGTDMRYKITTHNQVAGTAAGKYAVTSGMLSHTGLSSWNASQVVDGTTGTNSGEGFFVASGTTSGEMVVDLGSGNPQTFIKIRSFTSIATCAAVWTIAYSDNGSAWTNTSLTNFAPGASSFDAWFEGTWTNVGAHRYWKMFISSGNGGNQGWQGHEIEWHIPAVAGKETRVHATSLAWA